MIADEIEKHIEDQTEAYEAGGFAHDKAVSESIKQMGDPIESGVSLDRIHRPKMEWNMILLVLAITVFGIFLQSVLFANTFHNTAVLVKFYLSKSIFYTIIGIGIMLGIYFLDYTILGKHPVAFFFLYMFVPPFFARNFDSYSVLYALTTLFIPVYAGVVFHFRQKKLKGFLLCAGFFLLYIGTWKTLYSAYSLSYSISGLIELTICVFAILTVSILKGWFGGRKVIQLSILWTAPIVFPGSIILDALIFNGKFLGLVSYQVERIHTIFSFIRPIAFLEPQLDWINRLRSLASHYTCLGNGSIPTNTWTSSWSTSLPVDYAVTGMFSYFGVLVSVVVIAVLLCLFAKAFRISMLQRNRLGYLIGIGCSTSLLAKTVLYLASNFGYGLPVSPAMPFLSFGFCSTITTFAMMGLLLSVYRNTELVSEKSCCTKYKFKIIHEKDT